MIYNETAVKFCQKNGLLKYSNNVISYRLVALVIFSTKFTII